MGSATIGSLARTDKHFAKAAKLVLAAVTSVTATLTHTTALRPTNALVFLVNILTAATTKLGSAETPQET